MADVIRVVIDTNNLPRKLYPPSAAFNRIRNLVEEGLVQVAMPEAIAQEWRTQQRDHLRKQFEKAGEAFADMLDGGHLAEHPQLQALTNAARVVGQTAEGAESISQRALERLLEAFHTEIIPLATGHGARVLAAYFSGGPPFSSVKARKDFPDAYVYEAVVDLANDGTGTSIAVVTKDENLSKHLSALPHTTCYKDLSALAESGQIAQVTAGIAAEIPWRQAIPAIIEFAQDHEDELLGTFNDSFVNKLAHKEVAHNSIPSDNGDATISMVEDPEDLEIDWDNAEDYGPGVLRAPFSCSADVLLDFYIYHADAYGQPDFISVQWQDPEDRPFFDAQANATAMVGGYVTLKVDDWQGETDATHLQVSVDDIDEIDLEEDDSGNVLR